MKPPRTAFLDFPLGCPVGRPGDPENQRSILGEVLGTASGYGDPWAIRDPDFVYEPDGSRDWEHEVDLLYVEDAKGRNTLAQHRAVHSATGEVLAGKETEFTVRCYC